MKATLMCYNSSTLIFAGHDTTRYVIIIYFALTLRCEMYALDSGALACILQMLAEHPRVQEELRNEIMQCPVEDPDYTTLEAFPLLDAVIKETLRLVRTSTLMLPNHNITSSPI